MNVSSTATQAWLRPQPDEAEPRHTAQTRIDHRPRRTPRPPPKDPQASAPTPPSQDPSQTGGDQPTRIYLGPVPIADGAPSKGTQEKGVKVETWSSNRKRDPAVGRGQVTPAQRRKQKQQSPPQPTGNVSSPVSPAPTSRPDRPAVIPTAQAKPGTTIPVSPEPQVKQGTTTLKRLQGQGPVNLEPADSPAADAERIKQFGKALVFYRNDKSTPGTNKPSLLEKTDYEVRRNAIELGKGTDATSYVPEAKAYMGRAWASTPTELAGTDIVKLGAGKDGVAAIALPFNQLRPGSTVIVTGGPMRGSTMLFAADERGFHAYHAGASSNDPRWSVSENGARSIANAYRQMHPTNNAWIAARTGAAELVSIARLHPFSALIYNGEHSTDAGRKPYDKRIDAPVHATGADPAHPWHMMTYSYFEPGDVRSVGTAEAVISKDANGKVTVQVLGEKGKLDHMQTSDLHGGSVGFRYTTIGGATTSYTAR
jgi:hypothetical protein